MIGAARKNGRKQDLLVTVIYFGGDFLFEFGELVLWEGAGQDLRPPLDEVVYHVADGVEHLPLVPLRKCTKFNELIVFPKQNTPSNDIRSSSLKPF